MERQPTRTAPVRKLTCRSPDRPGTGPNPARRTSAKEVDCEVIASADALLALARWMAVCRGSARLRRGDPALARAAVDQAPEAGRPDRPPGAAAPDADGAPGAGSGGGP